MKFLNRLKLSNTLNKLNDDGYVKLTNVLTHDECDKINSDFSKFISENMEESKYFMLPTGNHSRLCNFHIYSENARNAILKSKVLDVLDTFFNDKAYIATSLYFEQSSQQSIHRDTPFFHGKPSSLFAGIWFALEDVDLNNGPLTYYPGGHKASFNVDRDPNKSVDDLWKNYCNSILHEVNKLGLRSEKGILKKGDCLIWHPELPHGGSEIAERGRTRKSLVFHCAPESSVMYGIDEFFGFKEYAPKAPPFLNIKYGRKMIAHDKPIFARND